MKELINKAIDFLKTITIEEAAIIIVALIVLLFILHRANLCHLSMFVHPFCKLFKNEELNEKMDRISGYKRARELRKEIKDDGFFSFFIHRYLVNMAKIIGIELLVIVVLGLIPSIFKNINFSSLMDTISNSSNLLYMGTFAIGTVIIFVILAVVALAVIVINLIPIFTLFEPFINPYIFQFVIVYAFTYTELFKDFPELIQNILFIGSLVVCSVYILYIFIITVGKIPRCINLYRFLRKDSK